MPTMVSDGPISTVAAVSPIRLAHVVYRTSRYEELVDWYMLALNATPAFKSDGIAFLAYDDEHHRIAIIKMPDLQPQQTKVSGVHHIAFTYENLAALLQNYQLLKQHGVVPVWSINHGPTTSMYYSDPDGNNIEFQIDNCDTVEEAGKFFFTPEFAANPLGVDFDPENLLRRFEAGDDQTLLKKRPPSAPRAPNDSPLDS